MPFLQRAWQLLTTAGHSRKVKAELAQRYTAFQQLLAANNRVLALMADLEEKLSGDYLFDSPYLHATVSQLNLETGAIVAYLNALGDDRYQSLAQAWERVRAEVEQVLSRRQEIPAAPLVLTFDQLDLSQMGVVGRKSATQGEVKNVLALPVPAGFAVSTYAYQMFLDYHRLGARLQEILESQVWQDLDSLGRGSEQIRQMIRGALVPPDLEQAMLEACQSLAGLEKDQPLLAMRASPVGEDLAFTFAGGYATHLNIPPAMVAACYKDIVASLFTPRALFHFQNRGFTAAEPAMAVVVTPMVRATASGVFWTRHPQGTHREAVLVHAHWGLSTDEENGAALDHYLVAYQPPGQVLEQVIAPKPTMVVGRPDAGVQEVPVHRDRAKAPCLNDGHLRELLKWALILEEHWGRPQEVKWALDYDGQLWVLECRPLVVASPQVAAPRPRTFKQYSVLLDQGVVACRGVGAGPVVMVREDKDLQDFPQGGVLVARQTSPRFASIMPRAAAIVTDAGSPTGHTALLAREYQVPTILNTAVATQVLKPGQLVTVDANYNNIYEGLIPELLPPRESRRDDPTENPLFQALRAVVQKVVPLNLLNPEDETFTPERCRTLHDIVRYAHEFSLREMFKLTENETRYQVGAVQLETGLPLMVLLLDLGGGLRRRWGLKVRPQQILSRPFQAFWQGLTAGSWPQGGEGRPPQSYSLLSANYMNFRLHLGALLATVEAYISEELNDNYLTFRFQGGDSMPTGHEEQVRRLAAILPRQGFACHRRGGLLEARFAKHSPPDTAQSLVWLGQLLGSGRLWDPAGFAEESGEALINDAGVN